MKGAFVPRAHVRGPTLMRVWAAHLHQRMPSSPCGAHAPGGQSKGHRGSARVSDLTVTSMSPSQEVWRDGRWEESKGNLQPFLVPVTPFPCSQSGRSRGKRGPPGPLSDVHLGHHLALPTAARPVFPQAGLQASSISSSTDAKMAGHGTSSGVGQSWDPQGGNFLKSSPCPCPTGRKEPQINPATPIAEVRAEGLGTDPSSLAIWGQPRGLWGLCLL